MQQADRNMIYGIGQSKVPKERSYTMLYGLGLVGIAVILVAMLFILAALMERSATDDKGSVRRRL